MVKIIRCDRCKKDKDLDSVFRVQVWKYQQMATRKGHKVEFKLDMCKDCFYEFAGWKKKVVPRG